MASRAGVGGALDLKARQGWRWPGNTERAHFFFEGFSLCGEFTSPLNAKMIDVDAPLEDDCIQCLERLVVLRQRERDRRQRAERARERRARRKRPAEEGA